MLKVCTWCLGGRIETTSGWYQVVAACRWQQGGGAGGFEPQRGGGARRVS